MNDTVKLKNQTPPIISCDSCSRDMVNIDAFLLVEGDLTRLKQEGIIISDPESIDNICIGCSLPHTLGQRTAEWFLSNSKDDSVLFGKGDFGSEFISMQSF
jgi:hypothetical protein